MLSAIPLCLATLVAPLATATPIGPARAIYPRDSGVDHVKVVSYQDKDCTGNAFGAILTGNFNAYAARNACWPNEPGKSFNGLNIIDGICDAAVRAYTSTECSGAGSLVPFSAKPALGASSSCQNVLDGYRSFRISCNDRTFL